MNTLDEVTREVVRLQRENLWMKRIGATVLTLLGLPFLLAQALPDHHSVEAEKFVLVSQDGTPGAELGFGKHGPALRILGKDGQELANLSGGGVGFYDGSNIYRSLLTQTGLLIRDKNRTLRANLEVDKDDSIFLVFHDKDGKQRAELVVLPDKSPFLGLYFKDGKTVIDKPETGGS